MPSLPARVSEWENSGKILAGVKLANAGLAMAWSFVLTFVFARILTADELANFVLVIALANFTIGLEFGFSNILYNRLRKTVLNVRHDFHRSELSALSGLMGLIVALAVLLLWLGMKVGIIDTTHAALFLLAFLVTALNLLVVLVKRALAAFDRNLTFESLDIMRRAISVLLLLAIFIGLDAVTAVAWQLVLIVVELAVLGAVARTLMNTLNKSADENDRQGAAHVALVYRGLAGRLVRLSIADILSYTAPFLLIAVLTSDIRPLLVYDLLYKLFRTVGIVSRVGAEAALPRITRAASNGERGKAIRSVTKAIGFGMASSLAIVAILAIDGERITGFLYDGKLAVDRNVLALIGIAVLATPLLTISAHLNGAFNRFDILVKLSSLLAIAAVLAPLSMLFAGSHATMAFLIVFTTGYLIVGALHARSLYAMMRGDFSWASV